MKISQQPLLQLQGDLSGDRALVNNDAGDDLDLSILRSDHIKLGGDQAMRVQPGRHRCQSLVGRDWLIQRAVRHDHHTDCPWDWYCSWRDGRPNGANRLEIWIMLGKCMSALDSCARRLRRQEFKVTCRYRPGLGPYSLRSPALRVVQA